MMSNPSYCVVSRFELGKQARVDAGTKDQSPPALARLLSTQPSLPQGNHKKAGIITPFV
jgi:hypothetical protein